jgi:hypothetical protein
MVVLLTENGKNSQWVNQEIGFAYALKKRPERLQKELPFIIPISQRHVTLKGFITKDTNDLLILDDFSSFEYVVANIVLAIRSYIRRGLEAGFLKLQITCSKCVDKKGFPYEFHANIPDNETLQKAIATYSPPVLRFICPQCKIENFVDARTFLSVK